LKRRRTLLRIALVVTSVSAASGAASLPRDLSRADLCVTEGTIDELPNSHRLTVDSPKMRAYVNAQPLQTIEARFTYLGATPHEVALGSGAPRRQFGLKLRAEDPCNLVYAMWRIEPESKLVVSIKENPGQHLSAECGNRGYSNIKPQRSFATAPLRPGDAHTLRAELTSSVLEIYVDEMLAWEGPLGAHILRWADRVGIRSDNVRVQFDLRSGPIVNPGSRGCRTDPTDTE
jgi:hypothetical protein